MAKIAHFLIKTRYILLAAFLIFAGLCLFLMQKVNINTDMTKYLPDSSQMSKGMKIMNEEFGNEGADSISMKLMFDDLSEEDKLAIPDKCTRFRYVSAVDYQPESADYNKDNHTLYILTVDSVDNAKAVMSSIDEEFKGYDYEIFYPNMGGSMPLIIVVVLLVVVLFIMLIMCGSYLEPFLFLFTIGVAIVLNGGTNAFLPSVSSTTNGISAMLQLVLSMDYSIILSNRYRQECKKNSNHVVAMEQALKGSIVSVSSSALTTIVGLLSLVFMSFKIGGDLGVVLAKGVLCSLICVFAVLPAIMIIFDKAIDKTAKNPVTIPMNGMAKFSYNKRIVLLAIFLVILVVSFIGKYFAGIQYDVAEEGKIAEAFPAESTIVVLYENKDEEKIPEFIDSLESLDGVTSVQTYANTLGKAYTAEELGGLLDATNMGSLKPYVEPIFAAYFGADNTDSESDAASNENDVKAITINQMFDTLLNSEELSGLIPESQRLIIQLAYAQIGESVSMLVGKNHSRAIINVDKPAGSDEMMELVSQIEDAGAKLLKGEYYIGNAVMAYEMEASFGIELNKITLITAFAIFLVIAFSFRLIVVPAILVMLIQASVYVTMSIMGVISYDMHYLALLIMQCVLMGATVDYAIVFTNYYREKRQESDVKESLARAYQSSIRTILTSGLIMAVATAVLGFTYHDQTIGPIVRIISAGVVSAMILIIVFLPSILAVLDKFVVKGIEKINSEA